MSGLDGSGSPAGLLQSSRSHGASALRLLALLGCAGLAAAADDRAPSERELHAAHCVATLETHSEDLADKVRAGRADLQPLLLERLESGAAFVGDAYMRGERDEARSKALKNAAHETQQSWSEAERETRQSACAVEGARLLAKANVLGRAVVSKLARNRLKKLLGN